MNTREQMFLYAVEEMSFTKAAERAFVTQQCLSAHISNLEKQYGTVLFDRRPKLRLTASGQLLYNSLLQIRNIEEDVTRMMSADAQDVRGELRIGIPTARATVILPDFLEACRKAYPGVKLRVELASSNELCRELLEGRLDMAVTVNARPRQGLECTLIEKDSIFLAAGRGLLRERLPEVFPETAEAPETMDKTEASVLYPEQLGRLPLIMNPGNSTVKQVVERYLSEAQAAPEDSISLDNYLVAAELVRRNLAAVFVPESMLLHEAFRTEEIRILRSEGLTEQVRIELAVNQGRFLPGFAKTVGELLVGQYREKLLSLRGTREPQRC